MKSMRRVSRGRSFLGLMTYLLRRDAEHRQQPGVPIGGTVCGTTARDIARELRSAAQQRPDIIKPVWHQALRLPQGERLPPLTWCRIAEVFMEEMGFDTAQQPYAVVLHDDPQGQHIHIAASRVGMDGRIYLGQNENLRASRLVIELEKRFGLQRTPGPDAHVSQRRRPTRREQGMRQRTGEAVPREVLQDRIDAVLAVGPVAWDDFKERLAADGISCLLNQSPSTGRVCGISFSYGGLPFKGSQLGKAYAIAGLQKLGLSLAPLPTREDTSPAPEAAEPSSASRESSASSGIPSPSVAALPQNEDHQAGRTSDTNEEGSANRRADEDHRLSSQTDTPGPDAHVSQRRRPTRREQGMRQRTGEAVPREVLQDRIDAVLADGPVAWDDFKERLVTDGISCLLNQASGTGRICGISFSYGGQAFKGSQLGKAYAIAGLQKRGLSLAPLPVRADPSPTPEAAAMPAPPEIEQQPTTRPKTLFEAILGHPPPESLQKPAPRPADSAVPPEPLPQEEPFLPANDDSPPESPLAVSDDMGAEEETASERRPRFGPG